MITMEKESIKVKHIREHRNGVGGYTFTAVHFLFTEDDTTHVLIGILTDKKDNCFVVEPKYPENAYRGDNFEPHLREAIEQWAKEKYGSD
jgi:hypothetical protein